MAKQRLKQFTNSTPPRLKTEKRKFQLQAEVEIEHPLKEKISMNIMVGIRLKFFLDSF